MADCPVCGSRLMVGRKFPHLFKKEFSCPSCGWKMDLDKIHEKGTLNKVKDELEEE